jgi:hypothetical protein
MARNAENLRKRGILLPLKEITLAFLQLCQLWLKSLAQH